MIDRFELALYQDGKFSTESGRPHWIERFSPALLKVGNSVMKLGVSIREKGLN